MNKAPNKIFINYDDDDEVIKSFEQDKAATLYVSLSSTLHDNSILYILESDHLEIIGEKDKEIERLKKENERVNKTFLKFSNALCQMYNQYCNGPGGHLFMSAGEETVELLENEGLFIEKTADGRGKFTEKAIEIMGWDPN